MRINTVKAVTDIIDNKNACPPKSVKKRMEHQDDVVSAKRVTDYVLKLEERMAMHKVSETEQLKDSLEFRLDSKVINRVRSITDSKIRHSAISTLLTTARKMRTPYLCAAFLEGKAERKWTARGVANRYGISDAIFSRRVKNKTLVVPSSAVADFCRLTVNDSVSNTIFGIQSKIKLPTDLSAAASCLYQNGQNSIDRAKKIILTYENRENNRATDSPVQTDVRMTYSRIQDFSVGRTFDFNRYGQEGEIRPFYVYVKNAVGAIARDAENADNGIFRSGIPAQIITLAELAIELDVSVDYFVADDYFQYSQVYFRRSDSNSWKEITDNGIKNVIKRLDHLNRENRASAIGEILAEYA